MMGMAMDNMTTESMHNMHMHHTRTSMDHDMSGTKHTSHNTYFHFSAEAVILFAGWTTVTWGGTPESLSSSNHHHITLRHGCSVRTIYELYDWGEVPELCETYNVMEL